MQMRPQLQIQSVIKAMTDVVLPAVDPHNKLAQEQSRLIIGTLALLARQLPLQFRFDRDELGRLLGFAQALEHEAGAGDEFANLSAAAASAGEVLERARAEPDEVLESVRSLRAATGAVIDAVFSQADRAAQARVQALALAMSKEQLLRDRSWLLSQGWEPDPKLVPPIETLLAAVGP